MRRGGTRIPQDKPATGVSIIGEARGSVNDYTAEEVWGEAGGDLQDA